jgi:hypothetical protein
VVGLGRLLLDRFVSKDAGNNEGSITTETLTFQGRKLALNVSAPYGRVCVEMLGERGQSVPGFGYSECDAISGDRGRHSVTWKGNSDVPRISEQPVQLRFHLTDAKLDSFAFRS